MRFSGPHFAVAVVSFLMCAAIVVFFSETRFIRGTLGDVLVVVLIYNAARSVSKLRPGTCALLTLGFAFAVEISQLFNLIELLGLGSSRVARLILGTTFDYWDLVAYSAGCALALLVDRLVTPVCQGSSMESARLQPIRAPRESTK